MPSNDKWNEFWMNMALQVASLSKDPITKVGSCIVTMDNRQCSIGYNGFPAGIEETEEKWQRPIKYEYTTHAEENAIINCPFDTKGTKIYITFQPCHKCIGKLIAAGIKEVYFKDYYERLENKHIWLEMSSQFDIIKKL